MLLAMIGVHVAALGLMGLVERLAGLGMLFLHAAALGLGLAFAALLRLALGVGHGLLGTGTRVVIE
jgi:hypothetical protein